MTDGLTLYFHDTPGPIKALLALEEMGLDYRLVEVDLYRGAHLEPWYKAINPNGKVPALTDGDVTIFDSAAILLYLAEKSGQFLPVDPVARGRALSWLMFASSGLGPFSGQAVHFLRFIEEKIPYAINRYARETERHYAVMERRLSEGDWFAGADYSVADMAAWGWVKLADMALESGGLSGYPKVKAWFDRVGARPAVRRTLQIGAAVRARLKSDLDAEARRHMFPQNRGTPAGG